MTKSLNSQRILLVLGIPLLLIAILILFANSPYFSLQSTTLSNAITIDFLITIPFIYFLGIRK